MAEELKCSGGDESVCEEMLEEARSKLRESSEKFEKAVEIRQKYSTALVCS